MRISGAFLGIPLQTQDQAGDSGRTKIHGFISVDVDDAAVPGRLELIDSSLQFADSGNWLPERQGGPAPGQPGVPESANFALWVDAGESGVGWGAIRDLVLRFEPEMIDVSEFRFAAPSLLSAEAGTFDYNVDVTGQQLNDQDTLTSGIDENRPDSQSMWQVTDTGASLVIPIMVSTLTELDLMMVGQVVATTDLPWRLGDFDADSILSVSDIDALARAVRDTQASRRFDLNLDGRVDAGDFVMWVETRRGTYLGDANLDGQFNSSDLVSVFAAGQYEDTVLANSTWATGDWTADAEFTSEDFVAAFQAGGYEQGPRETLLVPEPAAIAVWKVLWFVILVQSRSCQRSAEP